MNLRFWKGVIFGTAVSWLLLVASQALFALLFGMFGGSADFSPPLTDARYWVSQFPIWLALLFVLFIAVYIQSEFLEKLARAGNVKPLKFGAQFGVLYALPTLLFFISSIFYDLQSGLVPVQLDALGVFGISFLLASSVLAFAAAAWVYQKTDPALVVRTAQKKKNPKSRAKR